jgi:uncharacterized protein YkwD
MINRRVFLVSLVTSVGFSCPGFAATYMEFARSLLANPPNGGKFRPDLEARIEALTNGYRKSEGKKGLKASELMRDAARAHAADMMANGFMGHKASTGHGFDSRMRYFLGNPMVLPRMGENAARDTQGGPSNAAKADRLFQQWVKSRSHRTTMLSRSFQFMTVGVVEAGEDIWAVQIFWANPPKTNLGGSIQ